jgi:hypothetical protein
VRQAAGLQNENCKLKNANGGAGDGTLHFAPSIFHFAFALLAGSPVATSP